MTAVEATEREDSRPAEQGGAGAPALKDVLEHVERDLILTALRESHGNKAKAARALGITERLMGIRVKRLGIDWRGLRSSSRRAGQAAVR
jgi:transcriptional regulator with GAF, ATPase, and Fis domain